MTIIVRDMRRCLYCDWTYHIYSTMSCNTIGANIYTDGFIDGHMYSEDGAIITCPNCEKPSWREDIPREQGMTEAEYDKSDYHKINCEKENKRFMMLYYRDKGMKSANSDASATGDTSGCEDYEKFLRMKFWKKIEQEIYVRIKAWWSFNKPYRIRLGLRRKQSKNECLPNKSYKKFYLTVEQRDNLLQLLSLLDDSKPEHVTMKAEIYRELGEFNNCIRLLNKTIGRKRIQEATVIKGLAKRGIRRVAKI